METHHLFRIIIFTKHFFLKLGRANNRFRMDIAPPPIGNRQLIFELNDHRSAATKRLLLFFVIEPKAYTLDVSEKPSLRQSRAFRTEGKIMTINQRLNRWTHFRDKKKKKN